MFDLRLITFSPGGTRRVGLQDAISFCLDIMSPITVPSWHGFGGEADAGKVSRDTGDDVKGSL